MYQGHRLDSSSNITFSEDSPSKEVIVMGTYFPGLQVIEGQQDGPVHRPPG